MPNTEDVSKAMIKIRQANKNDQAAWDHYVENHSQHSPYHLYAWQYAVEAVYQHQSHYLIAEELTDSQVTVVGVFPLIIFAKPFSKPNLCALPFCDVGGVLSQSEMVTQLLIAESQKVAYQLQAKIIEVRTHAVTQSANEHVVDTTKASNEKVSMMMDLPDTSAALFSTFKSKLRSQIRKAEKNGLHYTIGHEQEMLDDFYQVFSHNMRALGSPVHAKQWFVSLLAHYRDKMLISVVYKDSTPIGAGIVLITNNKAAIPWASTKAEYNRLSPNMMLYWSFLKHLSDNNINTFDFGRSSYGEGTFKFKQQWGAKPLALDWQIINLQQTKQQKNKSASNGKLRGIVEGIWRKLPLKLTIFAGPLVRKYISL